MQLRRFIRDTAGFAGTQYVVRLLLMVRGVVAARLLGPVAYGAWSAIQLVIDYGIQTSFGTLQGLDQTAPAAIVDGDRRRLDRIAHAALFNLIVFGVVFAALALGYFARREGQLRESWGLSGVAVAAACALLTNVASWQTSLLRSHGRIGAVSGWFVIQGVIGSAVGLALIPWTGVKGLLWGWLLGTAVALWYARRQARDLPRPVPTPSRESIRVLALGFPMYLSLAITFVMRTLDRVIILRFLGKEALGYYSLAVMALGFLLYLPDSIAYVLYPSLLRRYRESGDDPAALRGPVERSMRVLALVMPALCGVAYLAADDAVLWLLPRFAAGVPSLRILCFGAAALGLASVGTILLMTLRRQVVLVPLSIVAAALGAGLMIWVIHAGYGIRGVAWSSLGTYAFHSGALLAVAYSTLTGSATRGLLRVARELLPLAIAIPIAWVCNTLLPGKHVTGLLAFARLVAGVVLFLGAYAVAMLPLARGIGLREVVRETPLPFLRGAAAGGAQS